MTDEARFHVAVRFHGGWALTVAQVLMLFTPPTWHLAIADYALRFVWVETRLDDGPWERLRWEDES